MEKYKKHDIDTHFFRKTRMSAFKSEMAQGETKTHKK